MDTKINKLKEIEKENNPFKVPENYFAQFNQEIMDKLPEKEIIPLQPVSLWDKVKPWVYMAAMFLGLYFTIQFLMKSPSGNNLAENASTSGTLSSANNVSGESYWSSAQITEEEFYQYLEDQLIDDSYFDYMYHQYHLN